MIENYNNRIRARARLPSHGSVSGCYIFKPTQAEACATASLSRWRGGAQSATLRRANAFHDCEFESGLVSRIGGWSNGPLRRRGYRDWLRHAQSRRWRADSALWSEQISPPRIFSRGDRTRNNPMAACVEKYALAGSQCKLRNPCFRVRSNINEWN